MPTFEILGKGKETGRKRSRTYSAPNEDAARRKAELEGTLVDQIVELPPIPPTEKQIKYAKDLGISIPDSPTSDQVGDLISLKVEHDRPSTERQRRWAELYGIEITEFIGKKALFNRIHASLVSPGREEELLSWFAFRVYRGVVEGAENAPIEGPDDPLLRSVAQELLEDEKVIKSVRRYRGQDLIWFGQWTSPEGREYTGGSNRTQAYRRVSALLKQKLDLVTRSPDRVRVDRSLDKQSANALQERKGCLSLIVMGALIPLGIVASVLWIGELFI